MAFVPFTRLDAEALNEAFDDAAEAAASAVSAEAAARAAADTAHVEAADPHPQYMTPAELLDVIQDSQVAADKLWSSQRIAAEVGRGSAVSYTYTGGVLTGISETLPGGTRTTTLNYTSGVLTSIVVVFGGITRTTTYTYTGGVLTGIATVES